MGVQQLFRFQGEVLRKYAYLCGEPGPSLAGLENGPEAERF